MKLAKNATYLGGENKNQGWGHKDIRFAVDSNPPRFEIGTEYVPYASVSCIWEELPKTMAEALIILERAGDKPQYLSEREVIVAIPEGSRGMGVIVAIIQHPASVEMPCAPENPFIAAVNACLR